MPIGQDKEISHKLCPFKASAASGHQEVGRSTSPREMCTHNCALFSNKDDACAIKVLAMTMAGPLSVLLQSAVAAAVAGEAVSPPAGQA